MNFLKMKSKTRCSWRTRCIVPIICALPFLAFALIGTHFVGFHPLLIGMGIVGLFSLTCGLYYGICRIEYRDNGFIVHPGRRRYALDDVTFWRESEDTDFEPGYQRYLHLQFGSSNRTYILFEGDISSETFDTLLRLLSSEMPQWPVKRHSASDFGHHPSH